MGNNPSCFIYKEGFKKLIFLFVTIFALAINLQAQTIVEEVADLPSTSNYVGMTLLLQGNPKSVVNSASYLFSTGIDNYIDVTAWDSVDYERFFLFLGGVAETKNTNFSTKLISSGIQGGLAARIADGHLGIYFNGMIADGGYINRLTNNESASMGRWNDQLVVMYANPMLGGLRLDILFNNAIFINHEKEDGKTESSANHLTTSLQWGRSFGRFTPRITFGVQWPSYEKDDNVSMEKWNNTVLGLLVELGIGNLGIDYQLSLGLGERGRNPDIKKSGYIDNNFNLYYDFTGYINTALTLKIRPTLSLGFYFAENKLEENGVTKIDFDPDDPYKNLPDLGFRAGTKVDLGVQYAVHSKISIYTGLTARIVDFIPSIKLPAPPSPENPPELDELDMAIQWAVRGIDVSGGNLAFIFNPSKNFYIELGLNNIINFRPTSNDGGWNWALNLLAPSGSLAISFSW